MAILGYGHAPLLTHAIVCSSGLDPLEPELRKPASSTSVLAEHSGISQEHIGPINIKSPPEDINWDKHILNHVLTFD